jgi:hypothetical protein
VRLLNTFMTIFYTECYKSMLLCMAHLINIFVRIQIYVMNFIRVNTLETMTTIQVAGRPRNKANRLYVFTLSFASFNVT